MGFISYQNVVFYRILLSTFTTRDRWYFKVRVTWWLNEWHLEYVFPFFSIFAEKTSLCLSSEKRIIKKKTHLGDEWLHLPGRHFIYTHQQLSHNYTAAARELLSLSFTLRQSRSHSTHSTCTVNTHMMHIQGTSCFVSLTLKQDTDQSYTTSSTITYCMCGIIIINNV